MEKSKHTPGPWLQEGNWVYAEGDPIRLSGGKEIRPNAFTLSVSAGPDRTREEAEANARLIAAAPDLLEVAQRSADALRSAGIEPRATSDNPLEWLLHQTEAAIAKATGEQS